MNSMINAARSATGLSLLAWGGAVPALFAQEK